MYSSRTGKLYNVLQIDGNDKITPELIEIMKNYDGIIFTSPTFNQSLVGIPGNIKYIDISASNCYKQPITNFPSSLIGIAFHASFAANNSHSDFSYLPYGIKIIYFTLNSFGLSPFKLDLPPSVEYFALGDKIHIVDMTHREVKKILPNDIHTVKSHIIFDIPFNYRYKYPIGF
jgi:hypothetical protein